MMTPQEQRIALAEWDGWNMASEGPYGWPSREDVRINEFQQVPDYPSDLNAVHELEKKVDIGTRCKVAELLIDWGGPLDAPFATSAQHCEALCRVLWPERWKD